MVFDCQWTQHACITYRGGIVAFSRASAQSMTLSSFKVWPPMLRTLIRVDVERLIVEALFMRTSDVDPSTLSNALPTV